MKEKIRNNHVGAQRLEGIPETRDTTVPFSRGITLISLIITIIILLILAGVTISFVMGNNGIFKFAQIAKENYENATEKEQYDLAQVDDYIEHARDTVRTTETILWEGTANQKTTYLFKDSSYDVDNYDRIIIEFSQNGVAKSSISLSKGFIKKIP